ncbi:MAG: glycosyltransferase [Chitinophagaceae bacterium]|nr:glycosyltransferase [Chitinophagaceae bacterium]
MPKILTAIKREKAWLHSFLAKNQVDGIISDNRYGLFHSHIPSAIITHQLLVKSFWKGIGERWMQRLHYRFIGRFKACWVPDYAGIPNLAGKLSHPLQLPSIPVSYTGPLTRFKAVQVNSVTNVLIILSGPEPQRTILEKMLLADLQEFNEPAIIVRGLPGQLQPIQGFNKVTIYNHLKAEELNEIVNSAQIVISRSGYSTVMDLMTLQKRCIFIPTPGQTEQLYLARYLASGNHCVFYSQGKFSLQKALDEIRNRTLTPFEAAAGNGYEKLLRDLPHL